jgi:hypothetical protein
MYSKFVIGFYVAVVAAGSIAAYFMLRNQPPVAVDDVAETFGAPVIIDVLANDSDPNHDRLTIKAVSTPQNGRAEITSDSKISYQPNRAFVGQDAFDYTISDGRGGEATARVSVQVKNRPPVAGDDRSTTPGDTPVVIDVLANDRDADGDSLTIIRVDPAQNGKTSITPEGKVLYRPNRLFFGDDTFNYIVGDGRGGEATGRVMVRVTLVPPRFSARTDSASLSEMMQQPPTNIYGSSINVFVYESADNRIAEIAVTGHADSLTCGQTSGAILDSLLAKRAITGEFLLAGSGRLWGGQPVPPSLAADPAVRAYEQARRDLNLAGQRRNPDEKQLAELKAKVDQLEANPKVQAYLSYGPFSQPVLKDLVNEANRISQNSGLVRVNHLPVAILQGAMARVSQAIRTKSSAVVEFRNLVPGEREEAAIMMPMLSTRTGEPVLIDVPEGEFSKQGFAEAVEEHRSELEKAIVGNAGARKELATDLLQGTILQIDECTKMSEAQLDATIELNQTCTPDGCITIANGARITQREYCETRLPKLRERYEQWLSDAQKILERLEADRKSASGRTLDRFAHATLIDSMLRDWDLPVGERQGAFDYWRLNRRGAAWEIISRELDRLGIDRRVLAGENIVFPASISDGRIRIRPYLIVDLQRSVVVTDERAGATAVVDVWGERVVQPTENAAAVPAITLVSVGKEPAAVSRGLERDPGHAMQTLLELWAKQESPVVNDHEKRLAKAKEIAAAERAAAIDKQLAEADSAAYEDWKNRIIPVLNALDRSKYASPEAYLRAALSIAKRISPPNADAASAEGLFAWLFLYQALNGTFESLPRFKEIKARFQTIAPDAEIKDLLTKARKLDETFVDEALTRPGWPAEPSSMERQYQITRTTPQTRIDVEVSYSEITLAALKQRSLLLEAYNLVAGQETGRQMWTHVWNTVNAARDIETFDDITAKLSRELQEIRIRQNNPAGKDTIVRAQISARLSGIAEDLMQRARAYDRANSTRYSVEHELITARIMFEEGTYAGAMHRFFAATVPVALWAPSLAWRALPADFKGAPDELRAAIVDGALVISARRGEGWLEVVRLEGPDPAQLAVLGDSIVNDRPAWSEGELVSEQVVTMQIPVRPELREIAAAVWEPALWLPLLKAMVYACAPPGGDLIELSGRCRSQENKNARHDRVANGGVAIKLPDFDALKRTAEKKFASP